MFKCKTSVFHGIRIIVQLKFIGVENLGGV